MSTDKLIVIFIGLFIIAALVCFTVKDTFETTVAIKHGLVQCKQVNNIIWTLPSNCTSK